MALISIQGPLESLPGGRERRLVENSFELGAELVQGGGVDPSQA